MLLHGDCLELMKDIPDGFVDMILCDLPYGMTQNKWDTIIPFDKLWEQYNRVIKDNGAMLSGVNWVVVASTAALAGVLYLLTSVAGLPEVEA